MKNPSTGKSSATKYAIARKAAAAAARAVVFYLGKLAWPEPLTFIYPRWKISADQVAAFLPAAVVAGALAALWLGRARAAAAAGFL
ncbi:MAG: hypothetical protein ACKOTE_13190, partial [Opitutaceae bacterium]